VGNAIKFTDSGGVQFAVNLATVAGDSHDAPALIFTVTDTGVDVPVSFRYPPCWSHHPALLTAP